MRSDDRSRTRARQGRRGSLSEIIGGLPRKMGSPFIPEGAYRRQTGSRTQPAPIGTRVRKGTRPIPNLPQSTPTRRTRLRGSSGGRKI